MINLNDEILVYDFIFILLSQAFIYIFHLCSFFYVCLCTSFILIVYTVLADFCIDLSSDVELCVLEKEKKEAILFSYFVFHIILFTTEIFIQCLRSAKVKWLGHLFHALLVGV